MANYWKNRTTANEAKARALAGTYSARLATLHNDMYKEINAYLDSLILELNNGETLTRTQLWKSKRYITLRNKIETSCGKLATAQIQATEQCLKQVFEESIGRTMDSFDNKYLDVRASENIEAQIINSAWSGKDFSSRIWTNTATLANRLESDLTNAIVLGNFEEAQKQLAHDMNVSYNQAHRLIVTEAAHVHTEATKEGYRQCGIEEVEWLAEDDSIVCEVCDSFRGQTWPVDKAPQLPQHCFCRCCLLPVIKMPQAGDEK